LVSSSVTKIEKEFDSKELNEAMISGDAISDTMHVRTKAFRIFGVGSRYHVCKDYCNCLTFEGCEAFTI
jgi:hypothetical protein